MGLQTTQELIMKLSSLGLLLSMRVLSPLLLYFTSGRIRVASQLSCKHCHLAARYLESVNRPLCDRAELATAKAIASLTLPPPLPALPAAAQPPRPPPVPPRPSPAWIQLQKLNHAITKHKFAYGPQVLVFLYPVVILRVRSRRWQLSWPQ